MLWVFNGLERFSEGRINVINEWPEKGVVLKSIPVTGSISQDETMAYESMTMEIGNIHQLENLFCESG